jgi:hypothetical protein
MEAKPKTKINYLDINFALFAELFFTLLPILVLLIAFKYKSAPQNILFVTDWAFAAAVLSGQTIIKFISGLLKSGFRINLGVIALIISGIFVFLLTPSLEVITLLVTSASPPIWLSQLQLGLFFASIVVFLLLGNLSETLIQLSKKE